MIRFLLDYYEDIYFEVYKLVNNLGCYKYKENFVKILIKTKFQAFVAITIYIVRNHL